MRILLVYLIYMLFLSAVVIARQKFPTPLEQSGYAKLTSHQEMMDYLELLDNKSGIITMDIIGVSVLGRNIPAMFLTLDGEFGSKRNIKPIVFIYCQQHGNEPSGKEAALFLARELISDSKELLEEMDIILVPMVNPDGAEAGQRRNANDMDLNRNYVILSEPEALAVHQLFVKWMPEVTLDVHEYNAVSKIWVDNGFIKDAEIMLDCVSNLNIDEAIRNFCAEIVIPEVGAKAKNGGYSFHRYVVGCPFDGGRMRYSTTAVNDGRQSMGIYNTMSFILEGKRCNDSLTIIERRTQSQTFAMKTFLETVAEYKEEILNMVNESRAKLLLPKESESRAYIQMDYFPSAADEKLLLPVFDLCNWQPTEKEFENFHPHPTVKKSVVKPFAYLFSADNERLIALLKRLGIEMYRLRGMSDLELEIYTIIHNTPMIEEELTVDNVDVIVKTEVRRVDKGTIFVPLIQPAGNLIPILLEPQSTQNIASENSGRKYRMQELIKEGEEYPIYRLMKKVELGLDSLEEE